MLTILIILGLLVLAIAGLAFYSINSRRPKHFTGKLKPLEKNLFQELEKQLGDGLGELIPIQSSKLNSGCRLYFPKSYTLELYGSPKDPIQSDALFPRLDEFKLATIAFTHQGIKFKAEFETYAGRVWGITVRPSPKKILNKTNIVFGKFKLNNDPTLKMDFEIIAEYYPENEEFAGILGELQKKWALSKVRKPLPKNQADYFINLCDAKLPVDFVELCKQTNGFNIEEVDVFGLGTLQSVPLDDDNYLILAQKAEGSLTLKQTKRAAKLTFHSYDESEIEKLGDSFSSALEKFIAI